MTTENPSARDEATPLEDLLLARLDRADLAEPVRDLVIAALLGPDELAAALGGTPPPRRTAKSAETTEAAGAYLTGIEVQGFRGIGPAACLDLPPGPGLTLVVGRNGSGKSSFAEAAELALTGDNKRWSGRTAVWQEGWRNLHHDGEAYLKVGLAIDGRRAATVERHWSPDADLADVREFLQVVGEKRTALSALGWGTALELYRPFLSYSELGAMLTGRPSDLYDSLQRILGLDALVDLENRLKQARKELTETGRRATEALPRLTTVLGEHPDPRARQAEQALAARTWDLRLLESLSAGDGTAQDPTGRSLRSLAGLSVPDPSVVADHVERLATARKRVLELQTGPAANASELASLLRAALTYHEKHANLHCPVCSGRRLDSDWASVARNQVAQLDRLAHELNTARATVAESIHELRGVVSRRQTLPAESIPEIDLGRLRTAYQAWHDLIDRPDPERIAVEATHRYASLAAAVGEVRQASEQALQRQQRAWQPVADELRRWTSLARDSQRATENLALVKRALTWLSTVGQEIREASLAPLAVQAQRIWNTLRQESNVELGGVTLASAGPRRHVRLDVTVDGQPGAALAVMSQGELHALALALFLPRATMSASPFRFLVIDDPVQSMDPAKVYGLARVLHEVAADRQVVVFTHDDRLPAAVRDLGLEATILQVTRGERSTVEVRLSQDPVARYLDDAYAVAKDDRLDEPPRAVVVAGLVRSAVEAACHERYRAGKLKSGVPHDEIEAALGEATGLRAVLALAVFGNHRRGDEVASYLRRWFPRAPQVVAALNRGVHGDYAGRLTDLIEDGRRLIEAVRAR